MSLKIAQQVAVGDVAAKQIVQMTLDSIVEALATEGRLELRDFGDFGVFDVCVVKARKGRNPRTGVEVMVPEGRRVKFKMGKVMDEKVNNGVAHTSQTSQTTTGRSAPV